MFKYHPTVAVVLGAGFSNCAHVPLSAHLSDHILSDTFNTPIDQAITIVLKDMLSAGFSWREGDRLPSLEDIFTMIDLSANTGHHLGRKLTPRKLRAVRRMLIHRVFSVLDRNYSASKEINQFLKIHLKRLGDIQTTHFVVLNWDIVLERHLEPYSVQVDYCVDAVPWDGNIEHQHSSIAVIKVHGSSNWVYCDNCRSLFFDKYSKLSLQIRAGLIEPDFHLYGEALGDSNFESYIGMPSRGRNCRICKSAVGPHIATFSYRKSFRTHAFAASWHAAEKLLSEADKWIFVGYSLPEADYEFKHLLKTTQLKLSKKGDSKFIEVVVLKDSNAEDKYKRFFGASTVTVFQKGLAGYLKGEG